MKKLVPPQQANSTATDWVQQATESRCESAMSARSNVTATTVGTAEMQEWMKSTRPDTGKTAGRSSDHELQKKLAKLEGEVNRERSARMALQKQVKDLKEEGMSDHGRSTARSRVTVRSERTVAA